MLLPDLILSTAYLEIEHNEDLLEQLFWDFDYKARKSGDSRFAFKGIVKHYVSQLLEQYQRQIIEAHHDLEIPSIGSRWLHTSSGRTYHVYDITNEKSERLAKFPFMIHYRRDHDSSDWSRPLVFWYQDFERVG